MHLLFVPISDIEKWSFTNLSSNEPKIEQGAQDKRLEDMTFEKIYNEMTGGCKGGLRLLHLHVNYEKERNKLSD